MVDTPIGTNTPNYTLVSGDIGATIFCRVTATNASGSAQAFSNAVGPVVAAGGDTLPANAGGANLPAIMPTTTVEGTLYTTTNGTWTGTPAPTFTRQWKSGATNVGTGLTTYTTVAGDVGNNITCVVTATNTVGSANATSNTVGPVTAAGPSFSGWNPSDLVATAGGELNLSGGNSTATGRKVSGTVVCGVRGALSHNSGKWYFEVTVPSFATYDSLIGLDSTSALGTVINPGIENSLGFGWRIYVGIGPIGNIGYNTAGSVYTFTPSVSSAPPDIFGFAVDMTTRTAWFRHNGVWARGNPETDTDGLAWGATPTTLFPVFCIQPNADPDGSATLNTGGSAFAHTIPSGFTAWG